MDSLASATMSLVDQSGAAGEGLKVDDDCWVNSYFDSTGSYQPGYFADCPKHIR